MKNIIRINLKKSCFRKNFLSLFTLIEVIVAMAILSLAVVGILSYSVQASNRMGKADLKWQKEHMLAQAVEFFLLAGPKEKITDDFFPYQDYSAVCEVTDPKLPDEMENEIGTWKLVTLKISVVNAKGETVNSVSVDTILQKDDAN
jgi:prepilin-type N-terminal cleavage/methylation domain-containing protein